MDDAQELTAISDVAQVSQWMSFMEGGFPLEKARVDCRAKRDEGSFFAVRLRNGAWQAPWEWSIIRTRRSR